MLLDHRQQIFRAEDLHRNHIQVHYQSGICLIDLSRTNRASSFPATIGYSPAISGSTETRGGLHGGEGGREKAEGISEMKG